MSALPIPRICPLIQELHHRVSLGYLDLGLKLFVHLSSPITSTMSTTTMASSKPSSRTLAHQDKLPKLPIPSLEDTCNRYLRALEALQDEKEHEATKAVVQEFLQTDGPKLHEALKEYAQDKARCVERSLHPHLSNDVLFSYIEEFW